MRKVTRIEKPQILVANEKQWTQQFLNELQTVKKVSKVNKIISERYKHHEIKSVLEKMYNNKCCYCENRIGVESYEQIEHLKPKSLPQFHHLAFAWENLHWCCHRCNNLKSDKWDEQHPIIDPTIDNPQEHLEMNIVTGELVEKTSRGKTTIDHAQLNRGSLVVARKRILQQLHSLLVLVKTTPTQVDDDLLKEYLNHYIESDAEFSSLIDTYLKKMM